MMNQESWIKVNEHLIAKSIGELTFEQILTPSLEDGQWTLKLASGVTYSFMGVMSIWEHLKIAAPTLKRNSEPVKSAAQFFIDSQFETKMSDIVLGNFLEEMHNTLYSDLTLLENSKNVSAQLAATLDGEELQFILNGHPKILLNKGRIGLGASDLEKFSPETKAVFKLRWIAIQKNDLQGENISLDILDESFDQISKNNFLTLIKEKKINLDSYSLIPVHPWQWDHYIKIQFAGLICAEKIIDLGVHGDDYRPQISIRTLSNYTRAEKTDIKLPLSILNTSCIRGLPAASVAAGTKVSKVLSEMIKADQFLNESGTEVLKEKSGAAFVHPDFASVKNAPYRYHEYLGAVWRESAKSKIDNGELAIITAALFYQDDKKNSLIGEYIKRSGLTQEQWLKQYFKTVVIPLYHIQIQYGVGMVAHGQNIILKLKNFTPAGMILKDFQGDLRLSTELPEIGKKYFSSVESALTKLPPDYLIHDLITGHFITVLRFISEVMNECDKISEERFYEILSTEIKAYIIDKKIDERQSLLKRTIPRVLLNKVRFAIGYSDSAERPLPMVGSELLNPLYPKKDAGHL